MAIHWNESFSTNNQTLDTQHKELFRLANIVDKINPRTTTKTEIGVLIKAFFNYMNEHFQEEEAYMQKFDYPFLKDHQKLHQDIIKSMTKLIQEKKTTGELQEGIKSISHTWLVEHILGNDLKMAKWCSLNPNEQPQ